MTALCTPAVMLSVTHAWHSLLFTCKVLKTLISVNYFQLGLVITTLRHVKVANELFQIRKKTRNSFRLLTEIKSAIYGRKPANRTDISSESLINAIFWASAIELLIAHNKPHRWHWLKSTSAVHSALNEITGPVLKTDRKWRSAWDGCGSGDAHWNKDNSVASFRTTISEMLARWKRGQRLNLKQ